MKKIKNLVAVSGMVLLTSLAVSAQQDQDKKPPPKPNPPPVIDPVPKNPPPERPKNTEKPRDGKEKPIASKKEKFTISGIFGNIEFLN